MQFWAPFALIFITAALLISPVIPALCELRRRNDAVPLPTSRHDGRITNFALAFESRIEPLRERLEQCGGKLERTSIDGLEVLFVGREGFDFDPESMQEACTVMCREPAFIPEGRVVDADVYATQTLELGTGAALRAGIGFEDIVLQQNSTVLRWLHARGSVYLRQGSTVYNRLSADRLISVERGCGFQHMQAPLILTLDGDRDDPGVLELANCTCAILPAETRKSEAEPQAARPIQHAFAYSPRIRVQGNFVLPAGESLKANIIATGKLRFGRGARFYGSAKSYEDTIVEEDACVHGSLACGGTVHLGPRSFVAGPVMSEGDVFMARGCCLGAPDAPTTLAALGTKIAAGCRIHGTVWSRVRGTIEG